MQRRIITLLVSFLLTLNVFSQQQVRVKIQDGSRIIINGSSNINRFSLQHTATAITERLINLTHKHPTNKIEVENSSISIPVKQFTTDDKMIQHSFYRMMQADQHPLMNIRLKQIDTPQYGRGKMRSMAQVEITITGTTRSYLIPVETHTVHEAVAIRGNKRISIKDFGITPPTAMMGLIRVCEWIDIKMDLICRIESISEISLAKD